MKKKYMTPAVMVLEIAIREQLLTVSGGGTTDIGYGGVDTEGELDPASRLFNVPGFGGFE